MSVYSHFNFKYIFKWIHGFLCIIKRIPALTLILIYQIASKLRLLQFLVNMNFDGKEIKQCES